MQTNNGMHADSAKNGTASQSAGLTITNRYLKKILYGNTEPYLKFNTAFPAAQE